MGEARETVEKNSRKNAETGVQKSRRRNRISGIRRRFIAMGGTPPRVNGKEKRGVKRGKREEEGGRESNTTKTRSDQSTWRANVQSQKENGLFSETARKQSSVFDREEKRPRRK